MIDIAAPKHPTGYSKRAADCRAGLNPAFEALARDGVAAGWTEDEVADALMKLAAARVATVIAHQEPNADVWPTSRLNVSRSGRR